MVPICKTPHLRTGGMFGVGSVRNAAEGMWQQMPHPPVHEVARLSAAPSGPNSVPTSRYVPTSPISTHPKTQYSGPASSRRTE